MRYDSTLFCKQKVALHFSSSKYENMVTIGRYDHLDVYVLFVRHIAFKVCADDKVRSGLGVFEIDSKARHWEDGLLALLPISDTRFKIACDVP